MLLFDDLDCALFLGFEAGGFEDAAKGSLADNLAKLIVFPDVFFPQMYKFLLADLNSSILVIIQLLLSNDKLLNGLAKFYLSNFIVVIDTVPLRHSLLLYFRLFR